MEKILFLLTGATMDKRYRENIRILKSYIDQLSQRYVVHVACISGQDDFSVFADILPLTYTVVSPRQQLDKICDFVSSCQESYTWYVKVRAEVRLLEQLPFDSFCPNSINTRARVYAGPLQIPHGAAVGGDGYLDYVHAMHYSPTHDELIVDEMLYIFHRNLVDKGAFAPLTSEERGRREWYISSPGKQHEWFHTGVWTHRQIPLQLVSLHVDFTHSGRHCVSAHLNLPPCPYSASECPHLRLY